MNIVVDFDRTLFNTDKIYIKLIRLVELYLGVTEKAILKRWGEYQSLNGVFNLFVLIKEWPGSSEVETNKTTKAIKKFLQQEGHKYAYPDARSFLQSYPSAIILTYGDPEFQQHKMKSSRLNGIGNRFAISEEKKWLIKEYFKEELVFLIDDHPETIAMVKKLYPHVICIQMKRRGAKYSAMHSPYADCEISTLSKVPQIIEKYT